MNLQLGYLVFGVRDPRAWQDFCGGMLGLPAPLEHADGSLGWRIDGARQRLVIVPKGNDDLTALGLDCGNAETLEQVLARLLAHGVQVAPAPAPLCQARQVQALHVARDPAGNAVELYWGLREASEPFASTAFPAGFRTAGVGMGHAALVSKDLQAMERFYVDALGFGVTERLAVQTGPIAIRGAFLHCNARHHSLALFQLPSGKRLHHFMLQANTHLDVGVALERARRRRVPLALDLGQHPAPDGTFSFYGITPSGFDFEIGAGCGEIDPEHWHALSAQRTSSWGHRPQWRAKWRFLSAWASQGLRGRCGAALARRQPDRQRAT